VLAQKHSKLSEKEKKELLAKYNATIRDLPKIFLDDPSIQHLNIKTGDVIKITRKSQTAGTTNFYRGVING
jgi:DNA-directed RNA polymerase subunit H